MSGEKKPCSLILYYNFSDREQWREDTAEFLRELADHIVNGGETVDDDHLKHAHDGSFAGVLNYHFPCDLTLCGEGKSLFEIGEEIEQDEREQKERLEELLDDEDIEPISLSDFGKIFKQIEAKPTEDGDAIILSLPPDFNKDEVLKEEDKED
jgi:hypothetical protein